jgi:AraC-like DNA-binding protein
MEPHSWMHIEGTTVARQVETLGLPTNEPFQIPDASVMDSALMAIFEEMTVPQIDPVILQNLFENWARGIRRQIRPGDTAREIPLPLLRVRRHLDSDFRRIPTLDELVEIAAMSRSHLCHQFREHFGSSISEYVIRKRMAAAQRMLYEVELRPGDIAEAVGYPDIYQFSKQFKKSFGVSPTQYRRDQVIRSTPRLRRT